MSYICVTCIIHVARTNVFVVCELRLKMLMKILPILLNFNSYNATENFKQIHSCISFILFLSTVAMHT